MTWLIITEIGFTAMVSFGFAVLYRRSNWRSSAIGRHLMAFSVLTGVECVALVFLGLGFPVPLWIFAIIFGALAIVAAQRLLLLMKVQNGDGS